MTATLTTVPFTVPAYTDAARDAALRVLDSGWTTTGPECAAFEAEFAQSLGVDDIITVASCTQALELSLRALRLPTGSPVLTPSLTFCGAVAAIVHAGYRPVLVDIDERTLSRTSARSPQQPTGQRRRRDGRLRPRRLPGRRPGARRRGRPPRSSVVVDAAHGPGGDVDRSTDAPSPPASASTPPRTCRSARAARSPPMTGARRTGCAARGCTG